MHFCLLSTVGNWTSVILTCAFPLPLIPTLCLLGNQSQSSSTVDGNLQRRDSSRRRTSAHIPTKTNHLVISGGDGYEDFRLTNSSETVGRDDSTNHLLLWKVWDNKPRFEHPAPNSLNLRTIAHAPVLFPTGTLTFWCCCFGLLLVLQSLCAQYGCHLSPGLTNEYDHFKKTVVMFLMVCVIPHWVVSVCVMISFCEYCLENCIKKTIILVKESEEDREAENETWQKRIWTV